MKPLLVWCCKVKIVIIFTTLSRYKLFKYISEEYRSQVFYKTYFTFIKIVVSFRTFVIVYALFNYGMNYEIVTKSYHGFFR